MTNIVPAEATTKFAAYLRTSTDDNQSPEDSRRWQLERIASMISSVGGEVVEEYHDVDVSRALPWSRREQGSRLLVDIEDPERGWTAVAIAEPARGFGGGAEFHLVFPRLVHHKVDLWVPELGGRVDPDSEAHEIIMGLFGGMSNAERRRIQARTRSAADAHGRAGRWLGGYTNYGYQKIDTDTPHPNAKLAGMGVMLRTLAPDEAAAPVVQRIFEMYDNGYGFRAIATVLEREGLPSPGEAANHARSAGVWSGSSVRAILMNPRYLGRQVVGRQRRSDELINHRLPALGRKSKQQWQDRDKWIESTDEAWPALIEPELFSRVNARITARSSPKRRQPHATPGKYLLSGLLRCGLCGRSMHGAMMKAKPYYRCSIARPDYAATDHPRATSIREERILAGLDRWLGSLTDPDVRAATIEAVLDADKTMSVEPAEVRAARHEILRCDVELERLITGLRAGLDPDLVVSQTKTVQLDKSKAIERVRAWEESNEMSMPLSVDLIEAALAHAGGVAPMLASSDREARATLYRNLGIDLTYNELDGDQSVTVQYQLDGGGGRI